MLENTLLRKQKSAKQSEWGTNLVIPILGQFFASTCLYKHSVIHYKKRVTCTTYRHFLHLKYALDSSAFVEGSKEEWRLSTYPESEGGGAKSLNKLSINYHTMNQPIISLAMCWRRYALYDLFLRSILHLIEPHSFSCSTKPGFGLKRERCNNHNFVPRPLLRSFSRSSLSLATLKS